MSDADSPAITQYLGVDCVGCQNQHALEAFEADTDAKRAWYRCPSCGHVAELRLDPDGSVPDAE